MFPVGQSLEHGIYPVSQELKNPSALMIAVLLLPQSSYVLQSFRLFFCCTEANIGRRGIVLVSAIGTKLQRGDWLGQVV